MPLWGPRSLFTLTLVQGLALRGGDSVTDLPDRVAELRWSSVDFNRQVLTVEGPNAKNRQTRHVQLNEEAVSVLRVWREQSGPGAHVFHVVTGFQAAWENVLKRARISKFRWHDLRHHFASRLVLSRACWFHRGKIHPTSLRPSR